MSVAYIQTDELASKIARSISRTSGIKIIRGWNEVLDLKVAKKPIVVKQKSDEPLVDAPEEIAVEVTPTTPTQITPAAPPAVTLECETEIRPIDHVIFVIHGIGQKMTQHMEAMSFINDCDLLRKNVIETFKTISKQPPKNGVLPERCGIQVLPIHWRHLMEVILPIPESEDSDEDADSPGLTLGDLLPEGIPGIRMLISDVVLDVLLYMTPRYRQEMIAHVTQEMNHVHKLFKENNPNFKGTFSFYGHSLGSVIGYDIGLFLINN